MPSFITQYKSSLKNPFAEELIDLALYRPLAFIFVKVTEPLPLTPNFVSLLAMVAGIGAGIAFASGTVAAFALGAFMFGLSDSRLQRRDDCAVEEKWHKNRQDR